ncbi:gas vesicle protein GvpG [Nocardioides sp. GXQ0305]|uniref:gas vesicle protein GvpG n=1 Tax=Nocardioides sp. GXQ0305 TaxID=3423912 RepID=UPI003D7D285E
MGLLSGLVGLPLAPLRGTVAVAEQVLRQAEEEFYDPARIRTELEEVARQREDGTLTDDEATAREDALVERLMIGQQRAREGRDG